MGGMKFLAVVLALGVGISAMVPCVYAQGLKGSGRHAQAVREKIDKVQARVDALTQQLSLTPDQQAKIKGILEAAKAEVGKIMQGAKEQVRQLQQKTNEDIRALLTPEQKAKFKAQPQKKQAE